LAHLWACIKNETIVKNILGSKMRLDNSRGRGERGLHTWGWHEPLFTRVMTEELKKGMTVVDIGANIGYYALLVARIVGNGGMVYAIEPDPNNFERLKGNIALNKYVNIESFPIAIGNVNSIKTLYQSESPNLHNLLGLPDGANSKSGYQSTINVRTSTLDEFLRDKKQPDLIRMDVEGYEYYIIEGMKNTLNAKRNMKIFMELHSQEMKQAGLKPEVMFTTLLEAGFKPKYFIRRTLQHPWQNPTTNSIDIKSFLYEGTIEKLTENDGNADGLLMEKIVS
jgi:FkbM family methyltransferase